MAELLLKILESSQEMNEVEDLQRVVWPGSEIEIVPVHLLITAVNNGGLAIAAYLQDEGSAEAGRMIGFVFGFVGLYFTPDGPRPKHCSHMLGVVPEYRDSGVGFALKRAQWQMVRHQGIDRITWTFDPLLSRNAHLNIARLGAVCDQYRRNVYGALRDGLNVGLESDRFEVDWWVNTQRVHRRLGRRPRRQLDLAHFLSAGAKIINPALENDQGWLAPASSPPIFPATGAGSNSPLVLLEIPADFLALKAADPALALAWRMSSRTLFEGLFERGYLVTDFVHLPGHAARSYYVLSHGESTL